MRTFSLGLMLFVAGMLAAPAGAAVSYSYSYVTDAKTYSGPVGSIVPVNIYLQETLSGIPALRIYHRQQWGQFGGCGGKCKEHHRRIRGQLRHRQRALHQFLQLRQPLDDDGQFPNPGLQPGHAGAAANNLEFEQTITNAQPGVTPTSSLLLLGHAGRDSPGSGTTTYVRYFAEQKTRSLTAPMALGAAEGDGNTLVQAPARRNAGNNFFPGTDLDKSGATPSGAVDPGTITGADANSLSSPYTFTVGPGSAPVPEPVSVAVFGVGAVGLLLRRRSRLA